MARRKKTVVPPKERLSTKIIEWLKSEGEKTMDEIVAKFGKETLPRIVKAVVTRMVRSGKIRRKAGKYFVP